MDANEHRSIPVRVHLRLSAVNNPMIRNGRKLRDTRPHKRMDRKRRTIDRLRRELAAGRLVAATIVVSRESRS